VAVSAEILIKDAFAQLQPAVLAIRANGFQRHSGHWHVLSLIEGGGLTSPSSAHQQVCV
jgi:hypothetical protein